VVSTWKMQKICFKVKMLLIVRLEYLTSYCKKTLKSHSRYYPKLIHEVVLPEILYLASGRVGLKFKVFIVDFFWSKKPRKNTKFSCKQIKPWEDFEITEEKAIRAKNGALNWICFYINRARGKNEFRKMLLFWWG